MSLLYQSKENVNDAFEMADDVSNKYGLEISLVHTQQGFVFSCSAAELEEKPLPKMFINVVSSLPFPRQNLRALD